MILEGITLPDDLDWTDEFKWSAVKQKVEPAVNGALIVQESKVLAGRPLTLVGGEDAAWVSRDTVEALRLLTEQVNRQMALTLYDGRVFTVIFNRQNGEAMEAIPITRGSTAHYQLTLRLLIL